MMLKLTPVHLQHLSGGHEKAKAFQGREPILLEGFRILLHYQYVLRTALACTIVEKKQILVSKSESRPMRCSH